MSQSEPLGDNLRAPQIKKRISTKWRKEKDLHFRYDIFEEKIMKKFKIDHDLDEIKNTKLISGILREWFQMKTIEEFQQEDPDLMVRMRKEKDKTLWIDMLYDHDDLREIDMIRQACEDILEMKERANMSKYKIK